MAEFEILSKEKHKDMYFTKATNYAFASQEPLLQISKGEMTALAKDFPIIFVKNKDGSFYLAALFTFVPKQNQFLNPDGTWKSSYIPAALRCHPFRLLSIKKDKEESPKLVLGFNKNSDLLSFEDMSNNQKIFDSEGNLNNYVQKIGDLLIGLERDLNQTNEMVKKITDLDIFVPLVLSDTDGNKKTVENIVVVSEEKLRALSEKVIKELLEESIIEMIFRHKFSIGNFQNLLNNVNAVDISTKEKVLRKNKEEKAAEVNNLVQNLLIGD